MLILYEVLNHNQRYLCHHSGFGERNEFPGRIRYARRTSIFLKKQLSFLLLME